MVKQGKQDSIQARKENEEMEKRKKAAKEKSKGAQRNGNGATSGVPYATSKHHTFSAVRTMSHWGKYTGEFPITPSLPRPPEFCIDKPNLRVVLASG